MLKDKILTAINKNELYKKMTNSHSDVEETNFIDPCSSLHIQEEQSSTICYTQQEKLAVASYSTLLEEDLEEEPLTFKDKILKVILSNKYFQMLVGCDRPKKELAELAKFTTEDNKVIMSADGKVFVFNS